MFYQVKIEHKRTKSHGISAFDLSQEFLELRVLGPYRKGKPITLTGKTIECSAISYIRIVETEEEFLLLADEDRYFAQLAGSTYTESERDVTDDLITGPPGSDMQSDVRNWQETKPEPETRKVFVVHGRNLEARDALFQFLRAIDLHPLEWSQAVAATGRASPYIGEILDAVFSQAHAVVVLLTPDDQARLVRALQSEGDPPHETQLTGQARPNVLFEAGMAMAGNQDRTILVELGHLRPFSDVAGRHVIRLDNSSQRRQELAQRLRDAGCPVNLEGTDWHTAGDFESAISFLNEEAANNEADETRETLIDEESQLSEEARELLTEAAKDNNRIIVVIRTSGGGVVMINRKYFGEMGDRRSLAKCWEPLRNFVPTSLSHPIRARVKHTR